MTLESLRLRTSAGTFDALAAGPPDGRPVLLLHGFPESARQWEHQLDALARAGMRAVAVDQRGYSPDARPLSVAEYGPDFLIADVVAFADVLGWEIFDLVGHDWGAAVAWNVAAAHPERLRTLNAVSVPHGRAFARGLHEDPDQRARSEYFELFRTPEVGEQKLLAGELESFFAGIPADRQPIYIERMREPGALTAALNWYRAMAPPSRTGPIITPTLYVWSTEDRFIGSTVANLTEGYVQAEYRFEVLEGVSHWISEEAPAALNALLLDHLAAH